MSFESLLIWIVVGLIAGWLASVVVGGGFGLLGDIVVGLIFGALHVGAPFGGLPGTIFVAFIGAVVLLLILRVVRRGRVRRY